jgi:tRNA nucleotidyltransferase (CCA-adding enzyme)
MEHCDVLFVLARMEDRVYLVARSRNPAVDVGDIAREFGGGGHGSAASATIRDQTIVQVEEKLTTILHSRIAPPRVARDFMSYPIKTVDASETLSRAGQVLTRYNINVLPVLKDGCLAGLISRQVIEKASHHGLKELPVEEYMVRDFATVDSQTPWPSIQKIIIGGNQRFLPVLKRGRLIGGITRTDLLRVLHADLSEEPRYLFEEGTHAARKQNKMMVHQMEEQLPPEMVGMLRDLGATAEAMGVNAFIVGGFVRDIFLRRNNLDVDLVIEGDGIAFAQKVAAQQKARVKVHKKFGTAVISLPGGFKVDVASARLEYYERPAALPQVEMSSIKLDLYRRDFTINTLAIRLNPACFGELIDFFGARKDIKEKTIRVIHNLSFVEDPTRILRAIRFEQRFGFHLGKLTQSLIENAVRFNFLERLDGRRLLSELILVLQEEAVILNLERMQALSVLPCIHPAFTFDRARKALCERIREAIRWYELSFLEDGYAPWKIYFMALIDGLVKNEVVNVCRRLFFSEREQRELLINREQIKNVLVKMVRRRTLGTSELYHLLQPLSVECLIYLMARVSRREAQKAISTFVTHLRHTAIETGGEDLKMLGLQPGRLYKKILDSLLDARLEGKVQTKADEIEFVREHFLSGVSAHAD